MSNSTTEARQSWWQRLKGGLTRTSASIGGAISDLVSKRKLDAAAIEELEEVLIRADLGVATAARIAAAVAEGRFDKAISADEVKGILAAEVEKVLAPVARPLALETSAMPFVILVVGVNGSGKTTTIGKLAAKFRGQGRRVMLAAGDTFRAAAIDQLTIWGTRAGAPVVAREPGADAAGLVFEALERARRESIDVLIVDTAGRLHTKDHLMAELAKIHRVIDREAVGWRRRTVLVLDATTGQNALAQAREFIKVVPVDGVLLAKIDGTAKGGMAVAVARELRLPVLYLGVGEAADDLVEFEPAEFARALLG